MIHHVDTVPYQEFAKEKLGFEFDDISLLIDAFTHRSYMNEHKKSARVHNERLEFLGDAVLELVVTDHLYREHDEPEGILTSWRSALVRTESIGAAGAALGYEPLLRLSRGEKRGSDRARQQILANAFEALIGAIYLEKGYEVAEKFIVDNILSKLDGILETESWRDPKSHLQEVSQSVDGMTPQYRVIEEIGPDHEKVFTLGVYVGNELMGTGTGHSKQIAQQQAATAALEAYKKRSKSK
ncbi:TPA: ribonuclease III [Candidatus Saccharibacteria bacterium]|nr:ribonuclease III [Candidatus Saccharibacteria bacterium]HRK41115.1 ribonuclease III [Candidatus Saccharibacteria bacterium]